MHLKSVGGGVINGFCWFKKCVLWQNAPKQDNSETAEENLIRGIFTNTGK